MKNLKFACTTAVALVFICLSVTSALAKDEARLVAAAVKTIKDISAVPKKGIPPALLKNAHAVAIFPGAVKTDFMVSGKQAEGFIVVQNGEGKWSAPVFASLSGGTLGWQVIAGPMDIILVFKTKKSIDRILKGKFTMDAKVAVVIGPAGQSIKVVSKQEQAAEILTYTWNNGSFADVVIAGATVQVNDSANADFYKVPKISAEEILAGSAGKPSEDARSLQKALSEYASRK